MPMARSGRRARGSRNGIDHATIARSWLKLRLQSFHCAKDPSAQPLKQHSHTNVNTTYNREAYRRRWSDYVQIHHPRRASGWAFGARNQALTPLPIETTASLSRSRRRSRVGSCGHCSYGSWPKCSSKGRLGSAQPCAASGSATRRSHSGCCSTFQFSGASRWSWVWAGHWWRPHSRSSTARTSIGGRLSYRQLSAGSGGWSYFRRGSCSSR